MQKTVKQIMILNIKWDDEEIDEDNEEDTDN